MRKEDFKILYEKFLNDTCSEEELQVLTRYFSELKNTEELEDVESLIKRDNRNIELSAKQSKIILNNILQTIPNKPVRRFLFPYFKYAVAASIFIVALLFLQQKSLHTTQQTNIIFKNESADTKKVLLQDGTSIYLKPHSQITQRSNFDMDSLRLIHLTGEAFFAIAHNAQKPFVVHTDNDFSVKVLGTRFNLISTVEEQEVVLTQGAVALSYHEKELRLKPTERAVYTKDRQTFETSAVDTLHYMSWINNQLYFLDTQLDKVIEKLNTNYAYETQKLKISNTASGLQFTGYLPTNNLDKCIKILNKTFANHHIIITKE